MDKAALPAYKTPMEDNYHPELDDSPLFDEEEAIIFFSTKGSLNWIITPGKFDVQQATNSLSRFNMAPREGHFTKPVWIRIPEEILKGNNHH